jgi:rubrerythrin
VHRSRPAEAALEPARLLRLSGMEEAPMPMKNAQEQQAMENLLYHLLETEIGGVDVYKTAVRCVQNEELREEFQKYLEQTERHVKIARDLLESCGLDPDDDVPARKTVRTMGKTLVQIMEKALADGDPTAAELTACEAVVEAETKDHMNWELLGMLAKKAPAEEARAMREAYDQVEDEEDEHLYHSKGWARELWIAALGMPAVLPPPEERKDVKTAIQAARAKEKRGPAARQQH